MEKLTECYHKAAKLLDDPEDLSVVKNVELHRRFWKPSKVRVLLLAESHVYTDTDDCIPMRNRHSIDPSNTPEPFVKLVYCLGYGESDFVGRSISKNSGTPQYWKIFASCISPPGSPNTFAPILKKTTRDYKSRIKSKVEVLKELKERGIWLLDASILALYNPNSPEQRKPPLSIRTEVLSICWDNYIRSLVAESKPEKIIVIGKGVESVLHDRIKEISGGHHIVLNQPQARMSSKELQNTHETYYRECQ